MCMGLILNQNITDGSLVLSCMDALHPEQKHSVAPLAPLLLHPFSTFYSIQATVLHVYVSFLAHLCRVFQSSSALQAYIII